MTGLAQAGAVVARLASTRAVCTCLGVSALPAVPRAIAGRGPSDDAPPASLAVWLLVGGATVPADAAARAIGPAWAPLVEAGLLALDGDRVRTTAAIVGVGAGVVVCDRLDVPDGAAPWPDDSSLHLLGALPTARIEAWLDVGTGAAIAPLARLGQATRCRATDLSSTALARAAQGAALSGASAIELATSDLLDDAGPGWDLISFNAPVPAEHGSEPVTASIWRRAPPGAALLERFWAAAGDLVADDGEVIVHSAVAADPWAMHGDRPGAWTIARYTPRDQPGFAISRWQPHAAPRRRLDEVDLDRQTPFVTRARVT